MLHTLATLDPHPESVPVNVLSKVAGTPLAQAATCRSGRRCG
jgi:biotin synthase-like enzyme